ncbi:MAG: hypothetical protein M1822_009624 [Bathelium mastoideum]|nr:MAG: hypothetical protein M1822_009624 [Bathelium mastoideum]
MSASGIHSDVLTVAALKQQIESLEKRLAQLEAWVRPLSLGALAALSAPGSNGDMLTGEVRHAASSSRGNCLEAQFEDSGPQKKAYTLRDVGDPDKIEMGLTKELEISDLDLIRLLKEVIGRYPGVNFNSSLVVIPSPFAAIMHNWKNLNDRVRSAPDTQPCKDLEDLLATMKATPELEDHVKALDSNITSSTVTFDTLWTLFAPETFVVARAFMGIPQILQTINCVRFSRRCFRVWAWHWDWNGKMLIRVKHCLNIERFIGTARIAELPYQPLRHHSQPEALCAAIRKRSLKFIKATTRCKQGASQMFRYTGSVYVHHTMIFPSSGKEDTGSNHKRQSTGTDTDLNPEIVPTKGNFISDAQAFLQHVNGWYYPLGGLRGRDLASSEDVHIPFEDTIDFEDTIAVLDLEQELDCDNDNFLLFPPRVLGYATGEKIWAQFFLDSMKASPGKQPQKFHEVLQLDDKHKRLIESLVMSFYMDKSKQLNDIIEGKGKGLSFLLHGPPGVGKTLTAETIAEATGKPLFVVSFAEIGLNPTQAERRLERLYSLATKWEAVLLLDDADVYLEARGATSDADRNALVTVLLRVLEYYPGIIVITTNRVKTIDLAILSRITLSLGYENLLRGQRGAIFKHFLDQIDPALILDREDIDTFVEEDLAYRDIDGREIRNAVSAALAIARYEPENSRPIVGEALRDEADGRLTRRHLKAVIRMTTNLMTQTRENRMQEQRRYQARSE